MRTPPPIASIVASALLVIGMSGCAQPSAARIESPQAIGIALGVAVVVQDINEIVESDEPSVEQIEALFADVNAVLAALPEGDLKSRSTAVFDAIRAAVVSGIAIKAALSEHESDLRDLRDALLASS